MGTMGYMIWFSLREIDKKTGCYISGGRRRLRLNELRRKEQLDKPIRMILCLRRIYLEEASAPLDSSNFDSLVIEEIV
ncbi:conserved hypothetical protein [Ricinus communis]|uniref:Uncharacterized protein n=1 Tax=Ricinus communis TaxID=3988 RepID=B9SFC6_RICCO|nr:conserved hypothetical protein [Ricinus communis]